MHQGNTNNLEHWLENQQEVKQQEVLKNEYPQEDLSDFLTDCLRDEEDKEDEEAQSESEAYYLATN